MGKRNVLHFSAELHTRALPFVGGVDVTAGVSQLRFPALLAAVLSLGMDHKLHSGHESSIETRFLKELFCF